jgi:hypothetical protein
MEFDVFAERHSMTDCSSNVTNADSGYMGFAFVLLVLLRLIHLSAPIAPEKLSGANKMTILLGICQSLNARPVDVGCISSVRI